MLGGGSIIPYIRLSVTQELAPDKEQALVDGLGEAMKKIPGKDGSLLIVDVEGNKGLYFAGERQENMVWAEIRYYSRYEYHHKKAFTVAVFESIRKVLDTRDDRMCLTITEFTNWGALGDFKDQFYSDSN